MDEQPNRLPLWAALLLLLLLLVAHGPAARGVAPFDTTFVGARLANHAASGVGPVYNPGLNVPQPPQPIASPLALGLVTCATWAGVPPLRASRGLALLAELAAAALLLAFLGHRPIVAACAVLLWAAIPQLGVVVAGGPGMPLALALALLACCTAAGPRGAMAGVWAGLAASAAPEAALVLPGIWLTWPRRIGRMGAEAMAFTAVVGTMAWAMIHWTGDWRPTPLIRDTIQWGTTLPGLAAVPITVLGLAGLRSLARGGTRERVFLPLVMVGILAALPWLFFGGSVHPRAAYLPLAILIVPASIALEAPSRAVGRPAFVLVAVAALVGGYVSVPRNESSLRREIWEPLGKWAGDENVAGSGAQMLASEIGFAGWFTGCLVQPAASDETRLVAQLLTLQPEYLLLATGREELSALRSSGDLARAWYPIERFSLDGAATLDPELQSLPTHPADDYLLFRRRL